MKRTIRALALTAASALGLTQIAQTKGTAYAGSIKMCSRARSQRLGFTMG
jgi:hypothetical protein